MRKLSHKPCSLHPIGRPWRQLLAFCQRRHARRRRPTAALPKLQVIDRHLLMSPTIYLDAFLFTSWDGCGCNNPPSGANPYGWPREAASSFWRFHDLTRNSRIWKSVRVVCSRAVKLSYQTSRTCCNHATTSAATDIDVPCLGDLLEHLLHR